MNKHTQKQSAFTIIELMVVVAILALLLALLMPALENARDGAITTACLSTQRQLFLGQQNYASDNNGEILGFAGFPSLAGSDDYFSRMEPYASRNAGAWIDPGLPSPGTNLWGNVNYGIAPICSRYQVPLVGKAGRQTPGRMSIQMSELTYPSTTAWLMEALPYSPPDPLATFYGKPPGIFWFDNRPASSWPMHGPTISAATFGFSTANGIRQFKSQSNVMRMDGSAKTYLWSELINRQYWFVTFGNAPANAPAPWITACFSWRIARGYLFSGDAPNGLTCRSGWLTE